MQRGSCMSLAACRPICFPPENPCVRSSEDRHVTAIVGGGSGRSGGDDHCCVCLASVIFIDHSHRALWRGTGPWGYEAIMLGMTSSVFIRIDGTLHRRTINVDDTVSIQVLLPSVINNNKTHYLTSRFFVGGSREVIGLSQTTPVLKRKRKEASFWWESARRYAL